MIAPGGGASYGFVMGWQPASDADVPPTPPPAPPPHKPKSDYVPPVPDIQGWMGLDEREWLFDRARTMRNVVEIGSWRGCSTHALLTACRGYVYAVDTWKGSPGERNGAHQDALQRDIGAEFWERLGGTPNLIMLRMESVQAAARFDDLSVDMVFIDGGHDYDSVIKDLRAWWPKCRRFFCGHDKHQEGVPIALKEMEPIIGPFKGAPVGTLWYIEKGKAA